MFIQALRDRYRNPELIEFTAYDQTGAEHEHVGFGRFSAEVKEHQRLFFQKYLRPAPQETP